MGNRLTVLLLVLAAVLVALFAVQAQLGLVDDGPIEARSPPEPLVLDSNAGAPEEVVSDLAVLNETVDRPLFTRDRRPVPDVVPTPEPQAPAVAASQQAPPPVELSAIVILDGRRMVLFRGAGAGGVNMRAEEGEQVQGWTLSQVRSDGVTLERNGQSHEIVLRTFKAAPKKAKSTPRPRRAVPQNANSNEAGQRDAAPASRRPQRRSRRRTVQRQPAPG